MVEFPGLDQSMNEIIQKCASNNNKANIATFLMQQDAIIHNAYNKQRIEEESKANDPTKATNVQTGAQTGSAVSKANSAFARMKALASAKK